MKILINFSLPYGLAHGGHAIQIDQTMAALKTLGLAVEPVRWWDAAQTGDVIHYFGRMSAEHIRFAHARSIKVVMAELLTAQGSRTPRQLRAQKLISQVIARLAPRTFRAAFNWDSYRLADALVALTPWEKQLMEYLFGAEPSRTLVVPNGVEEVFFNAAPAARGPWLISPPPLPPANGCWNWPKPQSWRAPRSGLSAAPMPKPIPMPSSFSDWPGKIRNTSATRAPSATARNWLRFTGRPGALCY